MAQYGIGNSKVRVRMYSIGQKKTFDLVVKDGISIKRSKNEPAVLTFTARRWPEVGDIVFVTIDDRHNQFYGYVEEVIQKVGWADVTCYDTLHFLQINTSAQFVFENMRASDVYIQIARDNQLPMVDPPHVMDTGYVIPYRIESNSKYLDIIRKALDLTYENTGKRFYIWDDFGNLCLHSEKWLADEAPFIVTAGYVEDYTFKRSSSNFYTASKVTNATSTGGGEASELTQYFARNEELIKLYGFREYHETLNEGEDGQAKANRILSEHNDIPIELSLSKVQGDITVRGGTPILVDFFTTDRMEYIRGWFCVDTVTHNFTHAHHTMDLELSMIKMLNDWEDNNPDLYFHE